MISGFLTFASFQRENRSSGWGIGQRVGLSDDEAQALQKIIPTSIDSPKELPRFPGREEVLAMDRRVAVLAAPWSAERNNDDKVLVYSSPAGEDATGRRGNVFSEAFVFRGSDKRRTSDYLGSEDLWMPFGTLEVNAVPVHDGTLAVGPLSDSRRVWEWIFDPNSPIDRAAVLRLLLSAVDYAVMKPNTPQSPKAVVIGGPSEEAALWIAAIHLSASPASLSGLTWSTFERANNLQRALDAGLQIICVPQQDYDVAKRNAQVICVPTWMEPATLDDSAQMHTINGSKCPVSEWETLFEYQCVDADSAARISDAAVESNESGHPAWHLAATALMNNTILRYLAETISQLVRTTSVPTNLSPEVQQQLLERVGVEQLASTHAITLLQQLKDNSATWNVTVQQQKQLLENSDLQELAFNEPARLVTARLASENQQQLVREILAADYRARNAIYSGNGLDPLLSEWLSVRDLAKQKFQETQGNAAEVDAMSRVLIGGWALAKLDSAQTTSANAAPADDGSANPWALGTEPAASDAGFGNSFGNESFGNESFGNQFGTGFDNSFTSGFDSNLDIEFSAGFGKGFDGEESFDSEESSLVAFGLNLVDPEDVDSATVESRIKNAMPRFSFDGQRAIEQGAWSHIFAPPAQPKHAAVETPAPAAQPMPTAPEPSGVQGQSGKQGQPSPQKSHQPLDSIIPFSEEQLVHLWRQYPPELENLLWARNDNKLWSASVPYRLRIAQLGSLFYESPKQISAHWKAVVSLLNWGLVNITNQCADAEALYLPWWLVDSFDSELIRDAARQIIEESFPNKSNEFRNENQVMIEALENEFNQIQPLPGLERLISQVLEEYRRSPFYQQRNDNQWWGSGGQNPDSSGFIG